MSRGTIRIRRLPDWYGSVRTLGVWIDMQHWGGVNNSASSDFLVQPGRHVVQVRMDWARSRDCEVVVPVAGLVELNAWVNGGTLAAMLMTFFNPTNVFGLEAVRGPGTRVG